MVCETTIHCPLPDVQKTLQAIYRTITIMVCCSRKVFVENFSETLLKKNINNKAFKHLKCALTFTKGNE